MGSVKTYWLSMHVSYACRDSGACCSSGWAIPVEHSRREAIALLRADGSWLRPAPDAPDDTAGTLAVSNTGHCAFHDRGCEIQRAYGQRAIPSACQHFPREVVMDDRGVFVTLSHYCPTALDLVLQHEGPIAIVEGPPAVPEGEPEGLDARQVLPPLLTGDVLMDLEGYAAWEAHMVGELAENDGRSPEEVLDDLSRDLAVLTSWRPGRGALRDVVLSLARARGTTPRIDSVTASESRVLRRYLAARAFASWMAYQGGGVGAVLNHLRLVLEVVRDYSSRMPLGESIRQTDLLVLHLTPRDELAARCRIPRPQGHGRSCRTRAGR